MIVYFVRHGESEGNATNTHQSKTTPLSDIGKDQAKLLAKRFRHIPVDTIIASDYLRTQQTAEILNQEIQKNLELTPLLREFKNPSEIQGKKSNDPLVMEIKKQVLQHKNDPNWHYSDDENFF